MKLKAAEHVGRKRQDLEALRAFHVHPFATEVIVLRNGEALVQQNFTTRLTASVPEYWRSGMCWYTVSFILGDGTWNKWIKQLYGSTRS